LEKVVLAGQALLPMAWRTGSEKIGAQVDAPEESSLTEKEV
jgi:hypothetical protein